MNKKVSVGQGIVADNASWTFGGEVPNSFSDHVKMSVPLYKEGHRLVKAISDYFVTPGSTCYELGSSVGELIISLSQHHSGKKDVNWVGIDVEDEMNKKAKENLVSHGVNNVEFLTESIIQHDFKKSDLIIAYYTMQFIQPKDRQIAYNKIYDSLNWGGAFILFEKVRAPDARFQDMMVSLYNDFKLIQGFSPDEIIAKTRSLKGIMEPFSTNGNIDLMKRAGFVDIMSVMKYICFEGFLAIK